MVNSLLPSIPGITPAAVGVWSIALMVASWLTREWRANRKLSVEDRAAQRAGFTEQVNLLTIENRKLREEYDKYRGDCQGRCDEMRVKLDAESENFRKFRELSYTESSQLRDQLTAAEYKIAGLERRWAMLARELARLANKDDADILTLLDKMQELAEKEVRNAGA